MNEDKKYETIGKVICNISYWFYALKFIFIVSAIAFGVLWYFDFYLWLAPIIGVVVFIIYRAIRIAIFRLFYKWSRM